jgi:hypothetical protein
MKKVLFWLCAVVAWLGGSFLLALFTSAAFEGNDVTILVSLVGGGIWGMILYLVGDAIYDSYIREW